MNATVAGGSFAGALASFCVGLRAADIPAPATEALKLAVLDGFASMLAGVDEPVSRQVLSYCAGTYGGGTCSVIGRPMRFEPPVAALVNGTIAHACDFDDSSWTMWGHPTAPLLPAVLAAAESRGASGGEVLLAFAAGLEVEKSLGLAIGAEHYARGWHPTSTLGLFGAVAGAGKIFGLDQAELTHAFGLAGSMVAGLRRNAGYGAKPMHTGFAARNGIEVALLAKAGVSADPLAFDGPGGVFELYAAHRPDAARDALAQLGNPFEVVAPGLSPKLYPCCSDIHCAIDAVLDLMQEHRLSPSRIVAIRCRVGPIALPNVVRHDPRDPVEAKFSLPYCIACAVIHSDVGLKRFTRAALDDGHVREFMPRVTVAADDGLLGHGEATFSSPAGVEITIDDGTVLECVLREMRGHPDRPLSRADYRGKFDECAALAIPTVAADALRAALERLDAVEDIGGLMRLAAGEAP